MAIQKSAMLLRMRSCIREGMQSLQEYSAERPNINVLILATISTSMLSTVNYFNIY